MSAKPWDSSLLPLDTDDELDSSSLFTLEEPLLDRPEGAESLYKLGRHFETDEQRQVWRATVEKLASFFEQDAPVTPATPPPSALTDQPSMKVDPYMREILRQVQHDLIQAQVKQGCRHQKLDLLEIITHPTRTQAHLNYMTPRRKMAWISEDQIQKGADYLRQVGRVARLQFFEGLLPLVFGNTLEHAGFDLESAHPIWCFDLNDANRPSIPDHILLPPLYSITKTRTLVDIGKWHLVCKTVHYGVEMWEVDRAVIQSDILQITKGFHKNLLVWHQDEPIGAVRVGMNGQTVQIQTLLLMQEHYQTEIIKAIYQAVLYIAQQNNRATVSVYPAHATETNLLESLGFRQYGVLHTYVCHLKS